MTRVLLQSHGGRKEVNIQKFFFFNFRKWNGTHFSASNFGDDGGRFTDVNGDKLPNGEHPSIMWNR